MTDAISMQLSAKAFAQVVLPEGGLPSNNVNAAIISRNTHSTRPDSCLSTLLDHDV
jgi:hypothetical protein